jgi:hypothetical protein
MSADKAIPMCLPAITELVNKCPQKIYCTQAGHPRAIPFADLRKLFNDLCGVAVTTECGQNDGQIRTTLHRAVRDAVTELSLSDTVTLSFAPATTSSIHSALVTASVQNEVGLGVRSVVLVCGSAFVMSDARLELGVVESFDGDILGCDDCKK